MKILLDTHIFLWWIKGESRLSKMARNFILDASEVYISSASIWEAAIKTGLGKLEVDMEDLVNAITASGFLELPILAKHAAMVTQLPNHHRDPFDRMLVAQAICEPLQLLTFDKILGDYHDLVKIIA